MKDLVQKFSKPHDLVFDAFAMALPIVKVCQLLDKHGKCSGCENDIGFV